MGAHFFQKAPTINANGTNLEAKALGAGAYAGRANAGASQKDVAAALALYKAHAMKPMKNSSAYAPGPKKL